MEVSREGRNIIRPDAIKAIKGSDRQERIERENHDIHSRRILRWFTSAKIAGANGGNKNV